MPEISSAAARRVPGLRGKLPPKKGKDKLPLRWAHEYFTEPLPAVTYPVDVSYGITDWHMLGNGPDPSCTTHPDGVGDCTFAGREHNRMAKAAAAENPETWESSDALVAEYLAYDNGRDIGANIADLLLSWYDAGTIVGFAPVDHTDRQQCDAAMLAFNGLYVGVQLTDDANSLFSQHQPWTVADGQQPDPREGHCIVKVGSDGTSSDTWVTWGAKQGSTFDWTNACLDEAWVMITSEDEVPGIDLAALRADIDALHGND